jgi:ubiquinone biosynthesis protein COQ4
MPAPQPARSIHESKTRPPRFPLIYSLMKVIRDPNETSHGARLVMTVDRRQFERNYHRFCAEPEGQRILEGAPSLFERLTDRTALKALPASSVGHIFIDYMTREGISTEELEAEVEPVEREILAPDAPRKRFNQHLRASHDLWHVLTGYHRDILGELQLLTFSHKQNNSPAFRCLSFLSRISASREIPELPGLLDLARERGAKTIWLPVADWGTLLARPIDEVRETIGMGAPPKYTRRIRNPNGRGLIPEPILAAEAIATMH